MQRRSSQSLIIGALIAVAVFAGCIFAWQLAAPRLLGSLPVPTALTAQPTGLVPVTGSTQPLQVPIGVQTLVGDVLVTVVRVERPADEFLGSSLADVGLIINEEILLVEVNIRCVPLKGNCPIDLTDFKVKSSAGQPADLIAPSRLPRVDGML